MTDGMIRSSMDMEQLALSYGILPFFKSKIPGFSIDEHTPRDYWFSNEQEGPWDWKGTVIREGHCAYGKFFNHKAAYITLELFPHLVNYRRHTPSANRSEDQQQLDKIVLEVIRENGEVTVKQLRAQLDFASRRGKRTSEIDKASGKLPLEPILERLMQETYVVIADFDYNLDSHGRSYGWGVARYTTPEALYGSLLVNSASHSSPEASYAKLKQTLQTAFPDVPEKTLDKFLK